MIRHNKFTGLNIKPLLLIASSFGIASASNAALFDCTSEPGYCIGEGDTVIFRFLGTTSSIGLFGTVRFVVAQQIKNLIAFIKRAERTRFGFTQ